MLQGHGRWPHGAPPSCEGRHWSTCRWLPHSHKVMAVVVLFLQDVVSGMCKILTRPAVTLKMRIGVSAARPLAVKVITTARKLGNVNAVAVRSRQLCALVSVSRLRPHTHSHTRACFHADPWTHTTAAVHEARRLGLHSRLCRSSQGSACQ